MSCKDRGGYWACTCVWRHRGVRWELTGVGVRVAVSFGPLIRGGLLVEVVLRLHQRERLCEEGATAYRLVLSQTAVTAALLRAVRQVKRDAPLRLEPRAQNRASDVSAPLCLCTPATLTTLCFYTLSPIAPPPHRHAYLAARWALHTAAWNKSVQPIKSASRAGWDDFMIDCRRMSRKCVCFHSALAVFTKQSELPELILKPEKN